MCGPEAGSHSSLFRNLKLLRVLSQHHGSSTLQASLWEPPVTHCPLLVPAHRGVPSSSHLSVLSLQFFPCSPFQPFVLFQHLCYSAVSHPHSFPLFFFPGILAPYRAETGFMFSLEFPSAPLSFLSFSPSPNMSPLKCMFSTTGGPQGWLLHGPCLHTSSSPLTSCPVRSYGNIPPEGVSARPLHAQRHAGLFGSFHFLSENPKHQRSW